MSVDPAIVRHIAKLARLEMSDAEVAATVPELNAILDPLAMTEPGFTGGGGG